MQLSSQFKGRLLFASAETLYLARGAHLFKSIDGGLSWDLWVVLPIGFWTRLAMRIGFLSRLLRLGVHHLNFLKEKAVVIVNKESFLIDSAGVYPLGSLSGSRPLALCSAGDSLYFGEYRNNADRSAVCIWRLGPSALRWERAWCFEGVRHIHGVFFDKFSGSVWVTTGDADEESAIWRTRNQFKTLERVIGGTQQLRAVQLLFSRNYVYFGSDTPHEVNHIYQMSRSGNDVVRLAAVGGSVFFGCQVGNSFFLSTVVEPSGVNITPFAEVWRTDDGRFWRKVLEFEKDYLSMRYLQYGQVMFPNGDGDGKHLFCTPFGTISHGVTFKIAL